MGGDCGPGGLDGYATGGYVRRTGRALLHQGEEVLTRDEARAGRRGGGGGFIDVGGVTISQSITDLPRPHLQRLIGAHVAAALARSKRTRGR